MVDEINVDPETKEEKQDYIDEMVAAAEDKETSSSDDNDGSENTEDNLLAGKYKTEEDLQKGVLELLQKQNEEQDLESIYKELESGLGSNNSGEETETSGEEDNNDDDDDLTIDEASSEEEEAEEEEASEEKETVDFQKYEQELLENNGELTEDSYSELEEMGYPKQLVDQYITGLKATASAQASEVYDITDGADNYQEMVSWAQDNLSPEEIQIFNQQVNSGVNSARFAAEALYSRYTKANGSPPKKLIQGDNTSSSGSSAYQSQEELMEDMSNSKYQTDPAFRRKVEQKLSNSDIL